MTTQPPCPTCGLPFVSPGAIGKGKAWNGTFTGSNNDKKHKDAEGSEEGPRLDKHYIFDSASMGKKAVRRNDATLVAGVRPETHQKVRIHESTDGKKFVVSPERSFQRV